MLFFDNGSEEGGKTLEKFVVHRGGWRGMRSRWKGSGFEKSCLVWWTGFILQIDSLHFLFEFFRAAFDRNTET